MSQISKGEPKKLGELHIKYKDKFIPICRIVKHDRWIGASLRELMLLVFKGIASINSYGVVTFTDRRITVEYDVVRYDRNSFTLILKQVK